MAMVCAVFLTVASICLIHDRRGSKCTPRYLIKVHLGITWPFIVRERGGRLRREENAACCDLSGCGVNFHVEKNIAAESRAICRRLWASFSLLDAVTNAVSSAYVYSDTASIDGKSVV